jgi:hypothetical protein
MDDPHASVRVEFPCREKDCRATVIYERKTVPGAFKKRKVASPSRPGVSVFLTCENGHVHRYEIPGPGVKDQATHGG